MKKKKGAGFSSYAFMLPAFIIYLSVIIVPVFYSLFISMHDWNGIGEMKFVGLKNYITLIIEDTVFHISIKNNIIWIILTLLVTTSVALCFAVLLNKSFRGRTVFRGLFYFPCVIAPIAVSIIWQWMYDPNIGFFNQFFKLIGLDYSQRWISDPKVSLFAIFAAALWQMIGQPMILFLAGLQAVPSEILEASIVDGANGIQRFFRVTIPLLKESFVIVIATLAVEAVNVYDIIKGLTDGGPNNATQMLSTYMYTQTFRYNNVGYGAAVACIMVLITLVIIVPYVSFTAKE